MGWRFRKSFSPLPGVRLTLSPSGITTSVGVGPLRVSAGPRGAALTANAFGTGLSYRQPLTAPPATRYPSVAVPEPTVPPPVQIATPEPAMTPIASTFAEAMTTSGLAEFKRLLIRARGEHDETSKLLAKAVEQERAAQGKFVRWRDGWILKHILKGKFSEIQAAAEESTALRAELAEQLNLARLQTQIDLPPAAENAFNRLATAFEAVARSQRIWDTISQRGTNQVAERTRATKVIERKAVDFRLGKCELLDTDWTVPHLANDNGGDIFIYPGFVLYFESVRSFALLEMHELDLSVVGMRFHENEGVPSDAEVVGTTWLKTNKDGTPDRRFKDNHELPVARYAQLTLESPTGMCEQYLISNAQAAESFLVAWRAYRAAVRRAET